MSNSLLKKWAGQSSRFTPMPVRRRPTTAQQVHAATTPQPVQVVIQPYQPQGIVPAFTPMADVNQLVRPGTYDPYTHMMANAPDMVAGGLVEDQSAGTVDAMTLPGLPDLAAAEYWKSSALNAYGVADSCGRLRFGDYVRQRYPDAGNYKA